MTQASFTSSSAVDRSEQEIRWSAQESHWTDQYRAFAFHFRVGSATSNSDDHIDYPIFWQPTRSNKSIAKSLGGLTPEESRIFCFKDCAVYAVGNSYITWRRQLYDKIYRCWYPSRAEYTDLSHQSFFCQFVEFPDSNKSGQPSPSATLKDVLAFHEALCTKLNQCVPNITEEIPL